MRRRVDPDAVPVLPRHLAEFDVEDWPDPGPPPADWDPRGYPWRLFKARVEWVRARCQWLEEHGRSRETLAALHGPDYARKGWYAR